MQILAAAACLGQSLLDFVYPPHCAACGTSLKAAAELLCPHCWSEITAPNPVRCWRCSCPLDADDGPPGSQPPDESCPNCSTWDPVFERVLVLGAFEGAMQGAIHALKFDRHQRLGRELGERLASSSDLARDMGCIDLLVPVPLHPARQRERGYNQGLCIAEGMAAVLGIPIRSDLVRRRKFTQQQAKLEAQERVENLRDAFEIVSEVPAAARIAVVDDVVTTGATLSACAQALQQGGNRRVWGAALASPFFLT